MSDANGGPEGRQSRRPGTQAGFSAARGAALVAAAVIVGVVLLQAIDDGNSGPIGDGGKQASTSSTTSTTTVAGGGSSTSSTTAAKTPTTLPPAQVTVRVLNGSGQQGVATTTTNTLKSKGYKTLVASNAALRKGSVVYFAPGRNAECKTVTTYVTNSTLTPVPNPVPGGQAADCIIVVGS
jgi:hypothetical protein